MVALHAQKGKITEITTIIFKGAHILGSQYNVLNVQGMLGKQRPFRA